MVLSGVEEDGTECVEVGNRENKNSDIRRRRPGEETKRGRDGGKKRRKERKADAEGQAK